MTIITVIIRITICTSKDLCIQSALSTTSTRTQLIHQCILSRIDSLSYNYRLTHGRDIQIFIQGYQIPHPHSPVCVHLLLHTYIQHTHTYIYF